MAQNGLQANLDSLSLSDTEADNTEDLFASPSNPPTNRRETVRQSDQDDRQVKTRPTTPPQSEEELLAAHEASLRQELSSLRSMNQIISGITSSLEKAKSNIDTVSATVYNASALLSTWTRILSQTEHNQRLILNPNWNGASQDIADGETEETLRKQEKERREAEEARRARDREAELQEEERRRMTDSTKKNSSRGRGTGRARSSGYVGVGGQGGVRGTARAGRSASGRIASGIGRGIGGSRGRGRGIT